MSFYAFGEAHHHETLNKLVLEDENLSWSAKGLWAYMMTFPDKEEMPPYNQKHLNELIESGYLFVEDDQIVLFDEEL